jgi:hypothetical protein
MRIPPGLVKNRSISRRLVGPHAAAAADAD